MADIPTGTGWREITAARLVELDEEIESAKSKRTSNTQAAQEWTVKINDLRRERKDVADYYNVGKRKGGQPTLGEGEA